MPKKTKFTLIEPNDDDLALFSKEYLNLGHINDAITELETSIPDKRTKDYEEWKKKVNFLIDMYNSRASFKSFKKYE